LSTNAAIFSWALTAVSLFGTMLNIRLDRRCFYIWSVTNACWMMFNLLIGQYAQAFLYLVNFALAIWGVIEWQRRQKAAL
jgi:nicotinamide riboside transporter PnuC